MRERPSYVSGKLKIPVNLTRPMEGLDYGVSEKNKSKVWHIGKRKYQHNCYGSVYAVILENNGMMYIGQTTQKIEQRVASHFSSAYKTNRRISESKFSEAIRKYGVESFTVWEVSRHYSQKDLDRAEKELIKKFKTNHSCGFNLESGGKKNFTFAESTLKKFSESRRGSRNPRFGKVVSLETREKIGAANRGENSSWFGKKHSQEELDKIGESNRRYYKEHPERAEAISARRRKKVRCITTGEVFDSMQEACEKKNVSLSKLIGVCKGRLETLNGLKFEYVKKEN